MKLQVLLSSYNGERFLCEQLNSLCSQTLDCTEILVRDDGSSDGTLKILEEYAQNGKIRWIKGDNIGPARSFWSLLKICNDAEFYAFCDQDDVWDADKLEIAVNALENIDSEIPALYCSDVRIIDVNRNTMAEHMVSKEPADFQHALIRNLAPGCTYVFNQAAKKLLSCYDADALEIKIHDWMAYLIVACFGIVIYDDMPHISYRQHAYNVIGMTKSSITETLKKIRRFWNGSMRNSRSQQAYNLEKVYGSLMTPENRELTALFAHYKTDIEKKKRLLKDKRLRVKGIDGLLFVLLVLLNRL